MDASQVCSAVLMGRFPPSRVHKNSGIHGDVNSSGWAGLEACLSYSHLAPRGKLGRRQPLRSSAGERPGDWQGVRFVRLRWWNACSKTHRSSRRLLRYLVILTGKVSRFARGALRPVKKITIYFSPSCMDVKSRSCIRIPLQV